MKVVQQMLRTVYLEAAAPDDSLGGHLRKPMNELINANLHHSHGL